MLARSLSVLRKEGVLVLGSGNIIHNLSMIDWAQFAKKTPVWAKELVNTSKPRSIFPDTTGFL